MKKYLSFFVVFVLALCSINISVSAIDATPTASSVFVDGEKIEFDAYLINDNNYFKLRDLAYTLNGTPKQFEVGYDGAANAISLTSGIPYTVVGGEMTHSDSVKAETPIPTNSRITVNGAETEFTAYLIGGNNYFKLRDIGEAMGFDVDWDSAQNAIIINTSADYTSNQLTSAGEIQSAQAENAVSNPVSTYTQTYTDDTSDDIVYITNTGKRYHRITCSSLRKSMIETTRAEAAAMGLTPCSICKPLR